MTNATTIHITDCVANGAIAQPSPDVLDTGVIPVALRLQAPDGDRHDLGRTIVEVANVSDEDLTVTQRDAVGVRITTVIAAGATDVLGPFAYRDPGLAPDGGRDLSDLGVDLTFTPASGTIGVELRAYRLPRVA